MWKPPVTFITLHYAYIIFLGILGLVILYPYGNLSAADAYFFGVSTSTVTGLNTVDVKQLKLYQQLFIYFVPLVANLTFVNIVVVVVRLYWFKKRLKEIAPTLLRPHPQASEVRDKENGEVEANRTESDPAHTEERRSGRRSHDIPENAISDNDQTVSGENHTKTPVEDSIEIDRSNNDRHISFVDESKALYIPPPRERDRGYPIVEVQGRCEDGAEIEKTISRETTTASSGGPRLKDRPSISRSVSLRRVASSMFVLGPTRSHIQGPALRPAVSLSRNSELPGLSSQATLGRNSQFHNLTAEDRERIGGIEYRSLKLLLKIVIGYFFGLHLLGVICLVPWIQNSNPKYRSYLEECGQSHVWWGIYSAQTMVDNLGFTLTPDSMVSFHDATFPMLIMSFLAYAGHTLYPCFLRLIIWIIYKSVPKESSLKEPLKFLLEYPRRCYMLLFRSRPTWVLFGILFVLNFVDVLLIVVLDLENPAVNDLSIGRRIVAAIFQAASSRHTGTSSFNLADVNPAVQISLLVMMYISIFPIAISVRASNTYEENALGIYSVDNDTDENNGTSYVVTHMRNQLGFDLWYIFLGIFCICVAEQSRIMDPSEPGFAVFSIFFEVVSAYANVGLSLGYPTVTTSLSGQFSIFSKIVICAMMIRGRHRGLPYQLDRSILIPNERLVEDDGPSPGHDAGHSDQTSIRQLVKVRRYDTK
ncbi:hypothetical protein AWENTII_004863 [Aspergillus wentii]